MNSHGRGLRPWVLRIVAVGLVVGSAGCATVNRVDPEDPLEPFNRSMFSFNEELDKAILKPAATIYRAAVPQPLRTGVSNFLGNFDDVWSFVNSLLQGKGAAAAQSFMRVSINTALGFGGLLDIASEARLDRHSEDFGQTLAVWGFGSGPYVVLPFFGPRTGLDVIAMPVDNWGAVINRIDDVPVRNTLKVLDQLDLRASFLNLSQAIDEGALDKYSFAREAYLQRRRNAIFDGNPPPEDASRPARTGP